MSVEQITQKITSNGCILVTSKTRADGIFAITRKNSRQLAKAVVVISLESSTLTLLKIASLPSRSETLHTDQEKRVNKRVL